MHIKSIKTSIFFLIIIILSSACNIWDWEPGVEDVPKFKKIHCKANHTIYSPEIISDNYWNGNTLNIPFNVFTCIDSGVQTNYQVACLETCMKSFNKKNELGIFDAFTNGETWNWFIQQMSVYILMPVAGTITGVNYPVKSLCPDYSFISNANPDSCSEEDIGEINDVDLNMTYMMHVDENNSDSSFAYLTIPNLGHIKLAYKDNDIGIGFGIARSCEQNICPVKLGMFKANLDEFSVSDNDGHTVNVTNIHYYLLKSSKGIYNSSTQEINFKAGVLNFVYKFMYGNKPGSYRMTNSEPLSGIIDFSSGIFELSTKIDHSDVHLELTLNGIITASPPAVELNLKDTYECTGYYMAEVSVEEEPNLTSVWAIEDFSSDDNGPLYSLANTSGMIKIPMQFDESATVIKKIVWDNRSVHNSKTVSTMVLDTVSNTKDVRVISS
jgi:hypothetical protein